MNNTPYIGVTGPVTEFEARSITDIFYKNHYTMRTFHVPMLGFLVSYKTLNGEATKNRRYPKFEDIPRLLETTKGDVFNMIHYNSKERETLSEQVSKIFEFENIYNSGLCRALQMNIVWPDIAQVGKIKGRFPEMKMVLQLSGKAMDGLRKKDIANKASAYGKSIDYILIDPSGGKGLDFDVEFSSRMYFELDNLLMDATLGFAGGLSGENVEEKMQEVIYIIQDREFCIDAEGKLRDKLSEEYGDDLLNLEKVDNYLSAASKILP